MEWMSVESYVVARVRYDAEARTLDIEFRSGKIYRYCDVRTATYDEFVAAESKGQFFNAHIRDRFICDLIGP